MSESKTTSKSDDLVSPKKRHFEKGDQPTPAKVAEMINKMTHERNFHFEAFGICEGTAESPATAQTSKMMTVKEWNHHVYLLEHVCDTH
jgi:hypothetical protein